MVPGDADCTSMALSHHNAVVVVSNFIAPFLCRHVAGAIGGPVRTVGRIRVLARPDTRASNVKADGEILSRVDRDRDRIAPDRTAGWKGRFGRAAKGEWSIRSCRERCPSNSLTHERPSDCHWFGSVGVVEADANVAGVVTLAIMRSVAFVIRSSPNVCWEVLHAVIQRAFD